MRPVQVGGDEREQADRQQLGRDERERGQRQHDQCGLGPARRNVQRHQPSSFTETAIISPSNVLCRWRPVVQSPMIHMGTSAASLK
jgi:hypothetical protein